MGVVINQSKQNIMSSFTISKQEYIKCAGALAAISDISLKNEIVKVFREAYESNVESVNKQYKDFSPADEEEYSKAFEDSYAFALSQKDPQTVMQYVLSFMMSSMYQIEDKFEAMKTGTAFIDILRKAATKEYKCWGSFDYKEDVLKAGRK